MTPPQLWLLVGGNGAGKSTFYGTSALRHLPFINADRIARRISPDAPQLAELEAARKAENLRQRYLTLGESFCAETVFSHPSKVDYIRAARARGFTVNLIYIHLPRNLHVARVLQRVSEGGHDVPAVKIEPRVDRLRENVREALPLCHFVAVYDNSDLDRPFELVLSIQDGDVQSHQVPLPKWAHELLSMLSPE